MAENEHWFPAQFHKWLAGFSSTSRRTLYTWWYLVFYMELRVEVRILLRLLLSTRYRNCINIYRVILTWRSTHAWRDTFEMLIPCRRRGQTRLVCSCFILYTCRSVTERWEKYIFHTLSIFFFLGAFIVIPIFITEIAEKRFESNK